MKEIPSQFLEKLKNATGVYIFPHSQVDDDAFCSAVGMSYALSQAGMKSVVMTDNIKRFKYRYNKANNLLPNDSKVALEEITTSLSYKADVILISTVIREFDFLGKNPALLFVDARPERAGKFAEQLYYSPLSDYYHKENTLVIDHHIDDSNEESDLKFIDSNISSASQMCYKVIKKLGVEPDLYLANIIFYGMASDSGFFQYISKESAEETYRAMAELVKLGIDPQKTYAGIYYNKDFNYIRYLSDCLKRIHLCRDKKIAMVFERSEVAEKYGGMNTPADDLFHLLRNTHDVNVIIYIKEINTLEQRVKGKAVICQIRVGVNSNYDASELAKKFNGGGHAKAASFKINEADMSFQQVVDAVKKEVGFVTSETL